MSEVKVRLPDGSERQVARGSSFADVALSIGPGLAKAALAVKANNKLRDMSMPIEQDTELEIELEARVAPPIQPTELPPAPKRPRPEADRRPKAKRPESKPPAKQARAEEKPREKEKPAYAPLPD